MIEFQTTPRLQRPGDLLDRAIAPQLHRSVVLGQSLKRLPCEIEAIEGGILALSTVTTRKLWAL